MVDQSHSHADHLELLERLANKSLSLCQIPEGTNVRLIEVDLNKRIDFESLAA